MGDEAYLAQVNATIECQLEDALSPNQQIFRRVWELEAEVNNGGFNQYFFNSAGRHATSAPEALSAIGASDCAALVDRALAAVDAEHIAWDNDASRQDAICTLTGAVEQALLDLDEAFYRYPDALSDLLEEFAKDHPSDFSTHGLPAPKANWTLTRLLKSVPGLRRKE